MPPLVDIARAAAVCLLVIGADFLWRRTRRASTLSQLVGAGLVLLGTLLEQIRWLFVLPADQSAFASVMRSEQMHIVTFSVLVVGVVTFLSGYFWFAFSRERI